LSPASFKPGGLELVGSELAARNNVIPYNSAQEGSFFRGRMEGPLKDKPGPR
jgi:hypothetical protein